MLWKFICKLLFKKIHSHWNVWFVLCRNIHLFPREIFHLSVRRFSTKQIKWIAWNEFKFLLVQWKYHFLTGINVYFYNKNPLIILWEWHFHKLLYEEMIFPLHKGKNDELKYEGPISFRLLDFLCVIIYVQIFLSRFYFFHDFYIHCFFLMNLLKKIPCMVSVAWFD